MKPTKARPRLSKMKGGACGSNVIQLMLFEHRMVIANPPIDESKPMIMLRQAKVSLCLNSCKVSNMLTLSWSNGHPSNPGTCGTSSFDGRYLSFSVEKRLVNS